MGVLASEAVTGAQSVVHVSGLASNESLIHFDPAPALAAELHKGAGLHGLADSVEHEPRGFLSDTDGAGDLAGTNSALTVADHPSGSEPLVEAKRGILEDAAHLDAELLPRVLCFALPHSAGGYVAHILAAAGRAFNSIRPAPARKELDAVIQIGEVNDCFLKCLWGFHDSKVPRFPI